MNRFTLTSLVGVVVFAMTLWLGLIGPKEIAHPIDIDTRDPIIAFEMASTPMELQAVIGEDGGKYAELRGKFDKVNQVDFVYMAVYGAFIVLFFVAVSNQRNDKRWLLFSVVAIFAVLGDARETQALLALTKDGADVLPLLDALVTGTWIKWFALGITCVGAAAAMFEDKSMPTMRLIGAIVGVSAACFTVAAYVDQLNFPQYMALGNFLTWIMMVVYAHRVGRAMARA